MTSAHKPLRGRRLPDIVGSLVFPALSVIGGVVMTRLPSPVEVDPIVWARAEHGSLPGGTP